MAVTLGPEDLTRLMDEVFPQVSKGFVIEEVTRTGVRVRLVTTDEHLRPGGTISGPSMFALADVGVYLAILARLGPVTLAVTTSSSMDFMRKPEAGRDLIADVTLLKLGRILAVGDVLIRSEGREEVVARATMTYSIPPR
ncbi:PaaI family thioesterase [Falsigemmobacter intermedius]|uniref:PaaI family thioesterase n=1 Tax=Falsigemmobacter intermedius TaxID=1553448 RepID=A0A444MF93_9RHOB|nr:PaaI family thioesterase [Falsigemmobacter intermedius]RWY43661.1 PaaI family thioesterase [Falsigemmobacter intermedius]